MNKYECRYNQLETEILETLKTDIPKEITYHNLNHTKDVINSAGIIAIGEGICPQDKGFLTVRTGALFHDTGYASSNKDYKNHEQIGANFAKEFLHYTGYNNREIKKVMGIIMATKLPQNPKTLLEKIVCDADVANFGRDDFFELGEHLRKELKNLGIEKSDKEWYDGTLKLLEGHSYHTNTAKLLWDDKKEENMKKLRDMLSQYNFK